MKKAAMRLFRDLAKFKPAILLISTPCAGLMGFSAMDRVINHAGWVRCRRISMALGRLAGKAAQEQM
eukprot:5784421-Prorocentrum_lima.AAC.1